MRRIKSQRDAGSKIFLRDSHFRTRYYIEKIEKTAGCSATSFQGWYFAGSIEDARFT